MKDLNIPSSLVLDLGTASTKAGWSVHGEPESVFPTVVGRGWHKGAMKTLGLRDSYVGHQAQNLRGILSIDQPIKQGVVTNWEDLETLWDFVRERETEKRKGGVDVDDFRVLVSIPPLYPSEDWRKLGELLLEGSGVAGIHLGNKSLLAMYGGGRTTGICVDSGEDMTYIVPCWEGSPLPDATMILKIGGRNVTDRMLSLLSQGKYSFLDDTFLLLKRGGTKSAGSRFCVASRRDVVREAKERYCKVSPHSFTPGAAGAAAEEEQVLRLPDGNIVVVGEEAFAAPEILFKPELLGKSKTTTPASSMFSRVHTHPGLHDLVYESVMRCDEKLRSRLLSNIMLTGGNSLIPGLDARLQKELGMMVSKDTLVRVKAQEGRENFTWNGGAHLCSLSSFQRLWLTKNDFMETSGVINLDASKLCEQECD